MYLLILATYLKGKLTKKRSDTESMQASTHWFVVVNKTSRNSTLPFHLGAQDPSTWDTVQCLGTHPEEARCEAEHEEHKSAL